MMPSRIVCSCGHVVAETYGAWGREAMDFFSKSASRHAMTLGKPKSIALHYIYYTDGQGS